MPRRHRLLRRRPPPRHARKRARPAAGAVTGLALFVGTMSVATASTFGFAPERLSALPAPATVAAAAHAAPGTTTTVVGPGQSGGGSNDDAERRAALRIPGPAAGSGSAVADGAQPPVTGTLAPLGQPPVAVAIPAIGVRSRLVQLGLNGDGTLEVPTDFSSAGWYAGGPAPGEPGPAVIAGHVDSYVGPAVFARLTSLEPGDEVEVTARDGSILTFRVDRTERHLKNAFPASRVYAATPRPELRLITCGGEFDRRTRSYSDNIVVYASLAIP